MCRDGGIIIKERDREKKNKPGTNCRRVGADWSQRSLHLESGDALICSIWDDKERRILLVNKLIFGKVTICFKFLSSACHVEWEIGCHFAMQGAR